MMRLLRASVIATLYLLAFTSTPATASAWCCGLI